MGRGRALTRVQEGPITRTTGEADNIIKGYADEMGAHPSVEAFAKIASQFSYVYIAPAPDVPLTHAATATRPGPAAT